MNKKELLKTLPSIDSIINTQEFKKISVDFPEALLKKHIRKQVEAFRKKILAASNDKLDEIIISREIIIQKALSDVKKLLNPSLRRVINATGTVIHTNLGRAPLAEEIRQHLFGIAGHYSNLEYDLEKGKRGSRYSHVEELICELTSGEAAFVVNNNAGAVLLVLSALTQNKEVIVSRGELVEIGGSFRIPDVLAQSGAVLVEVGTTNKTYVKDYERAISENTRALLKVHTSNYRICGFSHSVSGEELAKLAKQYNLISIEDLGSGTIVDFTKHGLSYEPTVVETVKSGIDIVTFSGDKLMGAAQSGIIVGKQHYIDKIRKHPLTRALRVDKLTLSALEMTLKLYLDGGWKQSIPVIRMITQKQEELKHRADELLNLVRKTVPEQTAKIYIVDGFSKVGGGAFPTDQLPTKLIAVKPKTIKSSRLEKRLRYNEPPIICRVKDDALLLDVRTIFNDELTIIAESLKKILGGEGD